MSECVICGARARSNRRCSSCLRFKRRHGRDRTPAELGLEPIALSPRRIGRTLPAGVSFEEYRRLEDESDGRCAICGAEKPPNRALAVDHDHESGRLRGLLCAPCNTGLGCFRDSVSLLEAAITYLARTGTMDVRAAHL